MFNKIFIIYILCLVVIIIFVWFIVDLLKEITWSKKISLLQEEHIREVQVLEKNLQQFQMEYNQLKFTYQMQTNRLQDCENLLENANKTFTEQFSNIANKTLNEQTDSFLKKIDFFFQQMNSKQQGHTQDFNKLLEPLVSSIQQFQNETRKMEQNHLVSNESIKDSLKTLTAAYLGLKEATHLLTSSHKTAGQWGEIQLIRLLEYTGLVQYCEFQKQVYMESEDGTILKPDVVVDLPGNISIAIDAKTSLISYSKFKNSSNEEERKKNQKEYYKSIKAHITSLGSKKYWSQFKTSPEMVIMFLPGENFWQVALEEDEEIMEYAYNMNVVVTTPLTLIPLLRMIASIWGKFQVSQESEDLRKKSIFLYETLVKLTNFIYDFGKNLDSSHKTYNKILALERDTKQSLELFREKYFPLLPAIKILQED